MCKNDNCNTNICGVNMTSCSNVNGMEPELSCCNRAFEQLNYPNCSRKVESRLRSRSPYAGPDLLTPGWYVVFPPHFGCVSMTESY